MENKQAQERCIELFNRGTLEWVDGCYSGKLAWNELPKASTPAARRGDFACFRRSAEPLLKLFPDR
jgi:hypothetical protein